eukprot:763295-Hanusia_phi.AAC.1
MATYSLWLILPPAAETLCRAAMQEASGLALSSGSSPCPSFTPHITLVGQNCDSPAHGLTYPQVTSVTREIRGRQRRWCRRRSRKRSPRPSGTGGSDGALARLESLIVCPDSCVIRTRQTAEPMDKGTDVWNMCVMLWVDADEALSKVAPS